jgi:hypothetical protein
MQKRKKNILHILVIYQIVSLKKQHIKIMFQRKINVETFFEILFQPIIDFIKIQGIRFDDRPAMIDRRWSM